MLGVARISLFDFCGMSDFDFVDFPRENDLAGIEEVEKNDGNATGKPKLLEGRTDEFSQLSTCLPSLRAKFKAKRYPAKALRRL